MQENSFYTVYYVKSVYKKYFNVECHNLPIKEKKSNNSTQKCDWNTNGHILFIQKYILFSQIKNKNQP